MPFSIRLDKVTEELLEKAAKLSKTTKSEIIRRSIREVCAPIVKKSKLSPSDLVKDLIEKHPGSGRGDLASRSEEILREMFKRRRHSKFLPKGKHK